MISDWQSCGKLLFAGLCSHTGAPKPNTCQCTLPFSSPRVCYALCTMQSKQGKANAALSILSRPKLFCSSGFTFTWRTSTCTHPPTSRKTQHEMVIQFTVSFNTHPQLKKHKYQIPIFLQNSHRKTLIPVQHKIQAFSVLQTQEIQKYSFSALSLCQMWSHQHSLRK